MTEKKKVLSLVLTYKLGGTAINSLRFIKNTKDLFDHFTIAHRVETDKDLLLRADYESHVKECFDVDTSRFSINSLLRIMKIVYRVKPHIVHVNGKGGALYGFFIRILYLHRFRLFYTMRGFHIKYKGLINTLHLFFEHLFNRLVTKAIAVSESEKLFYLKSIRRNGKRTVVIANGIEVKKRAIAEDIKDSIAKHTHNIVTLSRTDPQKDLVTMLNAFEMIPGNVGLHIMGGYVTDSVQHRRYKAEVVKLLATLKCRDRVYFWGDVNHAGDLISHFDVYWSTAVFEGLPTAIIEAMMSRVLVVATNCRGNIDVVNSGQTGLITEIRDVRDCKNAIIYALSIIGNEQHSAILDNAFSLSQKFSIANNVKAIVALYRRDN